MQATPRKKVIVIEDDEDLRALLLEGLATADYDVTGVANQGGFSRTIANQNFDLAIVDVNLPDGSGYAIARALRGSSDTRIIVLTGRGAVADRVESYTSGADIHLLKPTSLAELLAAVDSLLSRKDAEVRKKRPLRWRLDMTAHRLETPTGASVALNRRECAFLDRLMLVPGQPVPAAELKELLDLGELGFDSQALTMLVSRLRRRVKEAAGVDAPIQTVHRRGFAFRD